MRFVSSHMRWGVLDLLNSGCRRKCPWASLNTVDIRITTELRLNLNTRLELVYAKDEHIPYLAVRIIMRLGCLMIMMMIIQAKHVRNEQPRSPTKSIHKQWYPQQSVFKPYLFLALRSLHDSFAAGPSGTATSHRLQELP